MTERRVRRLLRREKDGVVVHGLRGTALQPPQPRHSAEAARVRRSKQEIKYAAVTIGREKYEE